MATRPDRNLAIERLLREGHAAPAGTDAGACIEAEELAAWVDGGLPPAAALRVEAHLASCPACQALLGAFASTEPAAAAARTRGPMRALLPLAAAAVLIVGVWLGTRQEQLPVSQPPELQVALAEPQPAPAPAPAEPPPGDSASRRNDDRQASARQGAVPLRRSAASRAQSGASQAVTPIELAPEQRQDTDLVSVQEKEAAAAPPAAVAPAPAGAPRAAGAAAEIAAPPQPQATPAASQRARVEDPQANARFAAAKAVDARLAFASPDSASRWRIVGTTLEVSADRGATWLPATGVTPEELAAVTSGASPARGVGWLVGGGGLVLVTTDGRRFIRTSAPAAVSLTGVEAQDGAIAEVRASDGRAWRTVDMGRTWMPIR